MIHQYKLNGYDIVIDPNSGSIHTVDDLAYDIIELYGTKTKAEIVAAMLAKYKNEPDITEEEVRQSLLDVENLVSEGSCSRRTI
jgi:uncharacterized protein